MLERSQDPHGRGDLRGELDFRQGHHKPRRNHTTGFLHERGHKDIKRPDRTLPQILVEWLDPNADERWQGPRRDLFRTLHRMSILLLIHPVSVTVLKIQPKILHRLAGQFFKDPPVKFPGECGFPTCFENRIQRCAIRREFLERAQGHFTQLARRLGLEKVGPSINRMHRLPPVRLARVNFHKRSVFRR